MQVKQIMTRGVEMIDGDATIMEAAMKMSSLDVGALPVTKKDKIIGVLTDRDITIRAVAKGWDPQQIQVSKIMTSEVCCCSENETLDEAAHMMEEKQLHRLIVLDAQNKPVGILALADLAVKNTDEHLTWEVLEQISEPAHPRRQRR